MVAQINGSIALNESYTLNTSITLGVDTELENNPRKGSEKQSQQINNKTEETAEASIKKEKTIDDSGKSEVKIEQAKEEKGNFITRFFRQIINFFRKK